jgi:hypothetical protein
VYEATPDVSLLLSLTRCTIRRVGSSYSRGHGESDQVCRRGDEEIDATVHTDHRMLTGIVNSRDRIRRHGVMDELLMRVSLRADSRDQETAHAEGFRLASLSSETFVAVSSVKGCEAGWRMALDRGTTAAESCPIAIDET